LKTLLLAAAGVAALLAATSAQAGDDHACLDLACNTVELFDSAQIAAAQAAGTGAVASLASPKLGTWGFDIAGMDRTVKPGDDFYRFANGTWDKNTEIPADRSSYGAFAVLRELSDARTRAILDETSAGKVQDVDAQRIAAIYKSYMDEARVEQLDARPLQADLQAIRAANTKAGIARLWGASNSGFGGSWFGTGISDDAKAPDRYVTYVGQGGLGMPDRDYYLDAKFAPQKAKYQQYIATVLGYAGWAIPGCAAQGRGWVTHCMLRGTDPVMFSHTTLISISLYPQRSHLKFPLPSRNPLEHRIASKSLLKNVLALLLFHYTPSQAK
jgi:putative endopeptidase